MRIYNREEFLKLPAGTIYGKGKPWFFDGVNVKGDTTGNDWGYLNPLWVEAEDTGEAIDRLTGMLERGESQPMEDSFGRDGCYDEDDIFLVFERADLDQLRDWIDGAISVSL